MLECGGSDTGVREAPGDSVAGELMPGDRLVGSGGLPGLVGVGSGGAGMGARAGVDSAAWPGFPCGSLPLRPNINSGICATASKETTRASHQRLAWILR